MRKIKNDWFTRKASEVERYRLENNLKDFYAPICEVYGPSSRNSHSIKSKDARQLTTKNEIKKRWVEHLSYLKTIQLLYSEVKARPVIEGELSNPFNYDCGVKQGCKLAPTL